MAKKICDAYMTYTCSCAFVENNLVDKKVSQKFKELRDAIIEQCIERDSKRENPLGEKVIRGIFNKYQTMYNLKEK